MSSTVLYLSMSLDGFCPGAMKVMRRRSQPPAASTSMSPGSFIAGPGETPDNSLGDGGYRLHDWPFPGGEGSVSRQIHDEFQSTGAIVAGKGAFEPAGGWDGDHHHGVPSYIETGPGQVRGRGVAADDRLPHFDLVSALPRR